MTRLLALVMTLSLLSCGRSGGSDPVPRATAWPRVEMPDSSFHTINIGELDIEVNKSATTDISASEDGKWITISYGGFAAPKIYMTLTLCNDGNINEVISNRIERQRLNLGGASYQLTNLSTPGGWDASMTVARNSLTTPVQILAHDYDKVLSGTLVLSVPDSLANDPVVIAPVIDAIERDMLVLLKNLGK